MKSVFPKNSPAYKPYMQFKKKVESFIYGKEKELDKNHCKRLLKWLKTHFPMKRLKGKYNGRKIQTIIYRFYYAMYYYTFYNLDIKHDRKLLQIYYSEDFRDEIRDCAFFFSTKETSPSFFTIKIGNCTFTNKTRASSQRVSLWIEQCLETIGQIKGWRHPAIEGNLKIVFNEGTHYKYLAVCKRDADEILLKTTCSIFKSKEAMKYILTHELGHRYEYRHKFRIDFREKQWATTSVSRSKPTEHFAELFAFSLLKSSTLFPYYSKNTFNRYKKKLFKFETLMELVPPQPQRKGDYEDFNESPAFNYLSTPSQFL